MTDKINVISSDLDGAQLRREKAKNPYHARCDGKGDDEQVNEALCHFGKKMFGIPADRWEEIFGGR